MNSGDDSSKESNYSNTPRTSFVAAELARAGAAVIVAPIAPSAAGRKAAQDHILHAGGSGGNFFLIHINTPLGHCEKTDRRGVYARARRGEIVGFTGIDHEYETPTNASLVVDASTQTIPEIVHSIVLLLETNALV